MKDWDGRTERRKMPNSESQENLKTFIQGEFKNFDTKLEGILNRLDEHHNDLYGADSDTPGIKLKVDRLEQAKKNAEKHVGVAWAAAIGLIIKSFWDIFTGHK